MSDQSDRIKPDLSDGSRSASAMMRMMLAALSLLTFGACASDEITAPEPSGDAGPAIRPEITAWLQASVSPFETPVVRDDRSDLEVLRDIVGAARVVSLGEATHGTREFFQMKHRVLDFLVKEMGFTHFAMEATWPEMNRIDDWVLGGDGDPAVLLSGQYFWTWRTQSVMDLLVWAREYNANRGGAPPVHVLGFDMQFPGMAIYNVRTFLEAIDPDVAAWAVSQYACIDANDPTGRFSQRYSDRSRTYKNECRPAVDEVYDHLSSRRAEYEAASSPEQFARALRSARLVQQFEDMQAGRVVVARDRAMAENAAWLLDQAGPDARMVLWAHNLHVSDVEGLMGRYLRRVHGVDHVIIGFSFLRGTFTAVTQSASGQFLGLEQHSVQLPPNDSYSAHFGSAGIARFILGLEGPFTTAETFWLYGPRPLRSIGCCYRPSTPLSYFVTTELPWEYDAVIFFESTNPTTVLPFTPPRTFDAKP